MKRLKAFLVVYLCVEQGDPVQTSLSATNKMRVEILKEKFLKIPTSLAMNSTVNSSSCPL